MTLLLLALLSGAADPAPRVCLGPAEVDARILEPLRRLERCTAEVEILEAEREGMRDALWETAAALREEQILRATADRRTRRARRGQARAGAGGAGAVLLIVLVLVLL